MYGTNLYNELIEFRAQRADNAYKVSYWSGAIQQVQLTLEFLFEVINERDEPLVLAFELAKCFFRLREYRQLVRQEKINVLLEMDIYKQFKQAQEHEESMCALIRSQRTI